MEISLDAVGTFPQLQKFVVWKKRLKYSYDFSMLCLDLGRGSFKGIFWYILEQVHAKFLAS